MKAPVAFTYVCTRALCYVWYSIEVLCLEGDAKMHDLLRVNEVKKDIFGTHSCIVMVSPF